MEDLTGKVAFITGGASGIGLGMARAFLAEGMKVALADWNDKHIAQAKEQLAGNNAAHFIKCNVADRANLRAAADETLAAFGKIHVLANNAGVNGGGTAASGDFEDWDRVMAINLGGVINGTKIIVPIIQAQREGGHVVEVPVETQPDFRPSRVKPFRDGWKVLKQIFGFARKQGRLKGRVKHEMFPS